MTAAPQRLSRAAVVDRLRAAGCVFAEDEARLLLAAARTPAHLATMVQRRAEGLPLEHIIGWAELGGVRIEVDPGVFVPRQRTELMVREAARLVRPGAVVLDLCCGSGAVGAALAATTGPLELHAADIDPVAIACARRNLAPLGGHIHQGDLYLALPTELRGRVNVLVANVPYVPSEEVELLPREARLHEPRIALDGGADGLDVLRRVAAGAPAWLAHAGHLLIEISDRQAATAVEIFGESGLRPRVVTLDELEATVVVGDMPAAPVRSGGTRVSAAAPGAPGRGPSPGPPPA